MSKNERRRTIVYSNVNKKADSKSASRNNDVIDLDNEIVIGLASFPPPQNGNKQKENKQKKRSLSKNKKNGQASKKINNDILGKELKKQANKSNTKVSNKNTSKQVANNKESVNKTKMTMEEKIRRKKIKILKRMSVVILMFVLLICGLVYFFLSPIFNVKSIEVTNNNYITKEQIINSSGIKMNENMFKFSKKEVKNNILSNPYIEDVKVSRNIFNDKIEIDIKERTATLMLEYGNSYVYINNQGYILEISTVKLDSPILKGYVTPLEQVKPGNRLNKGDLERLETVLQIIEAANSNDLGQLITQIDIKDTNDYIMVLESEDKTVYLGDCSNLSTQMLYVKDMVTRSKGVEAEFFVDMDLNTGRPVFREKV